MRRALAILSAALVMASIAAVAADDPKPVEQAPFAKAVVLRGTLGDAQIQMQLRPKEEFEGGVEGHYFLFGRSQQILLAGEVEGEQLFMEESINGTDVSGDWAGTFRDSVISGEWKGLDGGDAKPFRLEILSLPESDRPAKQ